MTANRKDTQRITPYLLYADVDRALDWLAKAFGFRETMRMPGPDGLISHAAMELAGGGVILMGCPGRTFKNPKLLGQVTQSLYIEVDDVDKHCARARKAGATIIEEPEDQDYGQRRYGAADPEGHNWYFAQDIPRGRAGGSRRPAKRAAGSGARRKRA